MANVSVSLWVQTDVIYSGNISDYDIADKIDDFTGSDNNIIGHKVFLMNGFTLGKSVTFNINAASAGYEGNKVQMQIINPFNLLFFIFQTGINNFLSEDLSEFISSSEGWSKMFIYEDETNNASGGELIVTPQFDLLAGRFVVLNNFSGSGDTCIITDYQPNTQDPQQGGIFTLGGF